MCGNVREPLRMTARCRQTRSSRRGPEVKKFLRQAVTAMNQRVRQIRREVTPESKIDAKNYALQRISSSDLIETDRSQLAEDRSNLSKFPTPVQQEVMMTDLEKLEDRRRALLRWGKKGLNQNLHSNRTPWYMPGSMKSKVEKRGSRKSHVRARSAPSFRKQSQSPAKPRPRRASPGDAQNSRDASFFPSQRREQMSARGRGLGSVLDLRLG